MSLSFFFFSIPKYVCAIFDILAIVPVSNICLKNSFFPPKDLEKIQAPKIRMRRFFKIFFKVLYLANLVYNFRLFCQ